MRGLALLRRGWAAIRRMYPALVAALVVTALAVTLYGVSQARQHTRVSGTTNVADATATAIPSATTASATATTQPPLSGPAPTLPPGPHYYATPTGNAPFIVQAVTIEADCQYSIGVCDAHTLCPTSFDINGSVWLPKNAPDGFITYRWHLSDGTVTAPAVAHYSWNDAYGQNLIVYHYVPDPATADGHPFWAQLEIMKPNEIISQRSGTYTVVCLPIIKSVSANALESPLNGYDCLVGGTQTFSAAATASIFPSPSSSFQYYWIRSDGSVSPTYTETRAAGVTDVTLRGDTWSVTPSTPNGAINDTLVIPHPPSLPWQTSSALQRTANFGTKGCPTSTPTPKPTATIAPTATPLPTPTP